nr:hypothetical protein [Tanacetum cinerariifolium]
DALEFDAQRPDSPVGKEVAKAAQIIADELNEMIRKLREDSPNMELTEEEMHDAKVLALTYDVDAESMKREIQEVEHQAEEAARLLKEHAELKVGEAGDNNPTRVASEAESLANQSAELVIHEAEVANEVESVASKVVESVASKVAESVAQEAE